MKKTYGLLGWPVSHSLSPAMHNAAFRALGLNAEYKLFGIRPEKLDNFLAGLPKSGICGLNVTVPYKEKVLKYLDYSSPEVKLIAACNVIIVTKDSRLLGYNTDGLGFLRHLQDLKFVAAGKTAAIIGAGGAAKAIAVAVAEAGAKEIALFDIVRGKAKALAIKIKKSFPKIKICAVNSIEALRIKEADLLVNATTVGMKPEDPLLVKREMLHRGLLVYDVIYNPSRTKLLQAAEERGLKASNGLGMLLYQGALSFIYFTAKEPPIKAMKNALEKKTSYNQKR